MCKMLERGRLVGRESRGRCFSAANARKSPGKPSLQDSSKGRWLWGVRIVDASQRDLPSRGCGGLAFELDDSNNNINIFK